MKRWAAAAAKCPGIAAFFVIAVVAGIVRAGDPELTTDYAAPEGGVGPDDLYFTFKGLRTAWSPNPTPSSPPSSSSSSSSSSAAAANLTNLLSFSNGTVRATRATAETFAALRGTGLSAALLDFAPSSQLGPHTHPRGAELVLVVRGTLHVGLVDSAGHFFNQSLRRGDVFLFPRGLLHYEANTSPVAAALVVAAYSSSNPGTLSLPSALFASQIPTTILAQAFRVSPSLVDQLKSPYY